MRLTANSLDAAFTGVEFRKDLDEVLRKHGAKLTLQRVHGGYFKVQAKFEKHPTLALTLIELPTNAIRGASRRYATIADDELMERGRAPR